MEDKNNNSILAMREKFISLLCGNLILLILVSASIYFVVSGVSVELGKSILISIFGALVGSGLLKKIRPRIRLSDDQVDGLAPRLISTASLCGEYERRISKLDSENSAAIRPNFGRSVSTRSNRV